MSVFPFNSEMSSACLTPEEEEFEAKSLEDQAYGLNKPVHGKDTGLPIGRIKLCDLKLRTINNTPVILGEGGFGKVRHMYMALTRGTVMWIYLGSEA